MKAKLIITIVLDVKSNHDNIRELEKEFKNGGYINYCFENTDNIRILDTSECDVGVISTKEEGKFCSYCDKLAGLDGSKCELYEIDTEDGRAWVCEDCYDLSVIDD